MAGGLRQRAFLAPTGHPRVDQSWVAGAEVVRSDAESLGDTGAPAPGADALAVTGAVVAVPLHFAAGARLTHLLMIGVVTIPFAVFVIAHDAYKRNRILAFINPWQHARNEGFQIVQSLLALGSGGPFGRGIGFSRQKFFWLPEAHTDFIGAIIGEELGFIQAFISIGVVTASWPVTGVPLPFISSGGTSLVVSLVAVALVANVGRRRPRSGADGRRSGADGIGALRRGADGIGALH